MFSPVLLKREEARLTLCLLVLTRKTIFVLRYNLFVILAQAHPDVYLLWNCYSFVNKSFLLTCKTNSHSV